MKPIVIQDIKQSDFEVVGEMMVDVYSNLAGFPSPAQQPDYYEMLKRIGKLSEIPATRVFIAKHNAIVVGAVVYFSDMSAYGAQGFNARCEGASGIRLLGVAPEARGKGIGKLLTEYCLEQAKNDGNGKVILHTTKAMQVAWKMYEKLGFVANPALNFEQKGLAVFGFELRF